MGAGRSDGRAGAWDEGVLRKTRLRFGPDQEHYLDDPIHLEGKIPHLTRNVRETCY